MGGWPLLSRSGASRLPRFIKRSFRTPDPSPRGFGVLLFLGGVFLRECCRGRGVSFGGCGGCGLDEGRFALPAFAEARSKGDAGSFGAGEGAGGGLGQGQEVGAGGEHGGLVGSGGGDIEAAADRGGAVIDRGGGVGLAGVGEVGADAAEQAEREDGVQAGRVRGEGPGARSCLATDDRRVELEIGGAELVGGGGVGGDQVEALGLEAGGLRVVDEQAVDLVGVLVDRPEGEHVDPGPGGDERGAAVEDDRAVVGAGHVHVCAVAGEAGVADAAKELAGAESGGELVLAYGEGAGGGADVLGPDEAGGHAAGGEDLAGGEGVGAGGQGAEEAGGAERVEVLCGEFLAGVDVGCVRDERVLGDAIDDL